MSKFKQIAVSTALDDEGSLMESLYALDEEGVVWLYAFEEERWEKLSANRNSSDS